MSCWITNGRHNAILADAIVMHGLAPAEDVEAIYNDLARVNETSMAYRYGDRLGEFERPEGRCAYVPGGELHPVSVLGLAESWSYQSCEHPEFHSEAITATVGTLKQRIMTDHGLATLDQGRSDERWLWQIDTAPGTAEWFEASERRAGTAS